MKRTLLSWSSGKDSAWSLHHLREMSDCEVVGLMTTLNASADRVAMHGVRRSLVKQQAMVAGLPLWDVDLPWPCSNEDYESAMRAVCTRAVQEGIECMAFGDLFLTEIRDYREKQLKGTGLEPIFPLWGMPTDQLACEMIASGIRAKLTCVDCKQIDSHFAGREFDAKLLSDLPAGADPCGENGEFHTFVYAGPMFRAPVPIEIGEQVMRGQFAFVDLVLVQSDAIKG